MSIKRKTSKTEMERYLNLNPPTNDSRYLEIRSHDKQWGKFMRWKYVDQFNQLYNDWWLAHPEIWDQAYEEQTE